jgi:hypothetical protein
MDWIVSALLLTELICSKCLLCKPKNYVKEASDQATRKTEIKDFKSNNLVVPRILNFIVEGDQKYILAMKNTHFTTADIKYDVTFDTPAPIAAMVIAIVVVICVIACVSGIIVFVVLRRRRRQKNNNFSQII